METLEGHQRAIMGTMTVEEIYQDRQKFSEAVFEVASRDLVNMGITVVSYTIKDIADEQGYLAALGMRRTAQVQRDALIGQAEAKAESGIKEARAKQAEQAARFENQILIAKSEVSVSFCCCCCFSLSLSLCLFSCLSLCLTSLVCSLSLSLSLTHTHTPSPHSATTS
jgi:hypothetical protein